MYLKKNNTQINIRLSSEELAMYKHCAKIYNKDVSEFVRASMLSICTNLMSREDLSDEHCETNFND